MAILYSRPLRTDVAQSVFDKDVVWFELHPMDANRQLISLCGVTEDGSDVDVPRAAFKITRLRSRIIPRDTAAFLGLADALLSEIETQFTNQLKEPDHVAA